MPMDPSMGGGMPPVDPATGQPMDPAMMGGMPPMDPAMAGMPMDPATGMPMDPAMMGPDPIVEMMEMIKAIKREVIQTRKIVAIVADTVQAQVPLNDLLEEEEDPIKADPQKAASDWGTEDRDGHAVEFDRLAEDPMYTSPTHKFSAAARIATRYFSGQ